jgi:hypothetical protein
MTYYFEYAVVPPGQKIVAEKLMDVLKDFQEPYLNSKTDFRPYLFNFDPATAILSFHETVNKDFMEEIKKLCTKFLGPVKRTYERNE